MGKYGGEDAKYNKKATPTPPKKTKPSGGWQSAWAAKNNPGMGTAVTVNHEQGNPASPSSALGVAAGMGVIPPLGGTPPPAPTTPTGPTGPTGPSNRNGSGSGSAGPSAAAMQAIKTLFAQFQRGADPALSNQLSQITAQAQSTGRGALDALGATLAGQQNPYATQVQDPVVAQNPLAQYMQAGGVDSSGVGALQQLLAASGAQQQQAGQAYQDRTAQSWQAGQQGRQADMATSGAAFQQALASQNAAYQTQLGLGEQKRKDDLMMQILQMAISQGADLGKLGVKF